MFDLKKFLLKKNIIDQNYTIKRELTKDEYSSLLTEDIHDKKYIDDCLKLIGFELNRLNGLNNRSNQLVKLNNCRRDIGKYLVDKGYLDKNYNMKKSEVGLIDYSDLLKSHDRQKVNDCLEIFGLEKEKNFIEIQQQLKNDRNAEIKNMITNKQKEINKMSIKNTSGKYNNDIKKLNEELEQLKSLQVSSNYFNKKYYSQTSEMEQKYLKYKNKYLSLKQKMEN
jgi:hypothetical protein